GGDMIERVSFEGTSFNEIPFRFEAGTPDIAGIVALGEALDYLGELGLERVERHEAALIGHAQRALAQIPGLRILGDPRERRGALAFTLEGAHPQDIGMLLDLEGIAVRTGHHCAMPLHARFGLSASARMSVGVYNTEAEIDALAAGLRRIAAMFQ
ncbi:MAG TPA: aminotransferase class V-fold PLP-dependent enzyme, partial [Rhodospirillales bacterium]|nr:aminotransferase class V-fold PLP-dependent enzyme [Rhodospirillales bacterium]